MRRSTPTSKLGALFMIMMAVIFNCFAGMALGGAVGHPYAGMALTNAIGLAQNGARMYYQYKGIEFSEPAIFMDGLNREVWIDQLIEILRPDDSFTGDGEDWSEWVENDAINLAAVGADPVVVINNTTWPLVPTPRTDSPLRIELDTFSSTPTRVQRIETAELVYNKLDSVNRGHVLAIKEQFGIYAAWNWAPTVSSGATPVVKASGPIDPNTGLNIVLSADIAALALEFDNLLYPDKGRTLLMTPNALWSLVNNDPKLIQQYGFQSQVGTVPGVITDYYGFTIKKYVYTPTYRLIGYVPAIAGVAPTEVFTVGTGAATSDTWTAEWGSLKVVGSPLVLAAGTATQTATAIVTAINAYTATSGCTAVQGSGGVFTVTLPVSVGASLNTTSATITETGTVSSTCTTVTGGITAVPSTPGIWTKNALGSTPTPGTDFNGAIAYIAKNGIVKAWGSVEFFSQMNEPTYQADMVSYSVRGLARAKQQARIGFLVQTTS